MAFKPVGGKDDRGQGWLVMEGDPAWPHVHRLELAGVREIVLPRETYITGRLAEVNVPKYLDVMDPANPALRDILLRSVRLRDCLAFLGKEGTKALHGATTVQPKPEHCGEAAAMAASQADAPGGYPAGEPRL